APETGEATQPPDAPSDAAGDAPPEPIEGASQASGQTRPQAAAPETRWAYAAPRIDQIAGHASIRTEPRQPDEPRFARIVPPAAGRRSDDPHPDRSTLATLELPGCADLSAPTLQGYGYGDIEAALGLVPGQTPFERLEDILDPQAGGQAGGPPLDEPSTIVAQRALRAIIEDARGSDVTRQETIENWLANLLAGAWPRSAPLLEAATEAFRWQEEWHRFDARPQIRFLGARLRGERFRAKVADPAHRYHRAWRELNRPGRGGLLRSRAAHDDVQFLLGGIRQNFPHIESELDPRRVEWWNRKTVHWPRLLLALVWLLFVLRVFGWGWDWPFADTRFALPDGSEIELSDRGDPKPAALERALQATLDNSFGPGHTLEWLWHGDDSLAKALVARLRSDLQTGRDESYRLRDTANLVRQRTDMKGRQSAGQALEQAMALRLAQLRAARATSPAACLEMLHSARFPITVNVPSRLRVLERLTATRLIDAPPSLESAPSGSETVSIPGALVKIVIETTGLDAARVRDALQGAGDDVARCDVTIALLAATLEWKGDTAQRDAILRSL
ncbi:hypothetical protein MTR62_18230, partial [Novosphingobium sp. 1949]